MKIRMKQSVSGTRNGEPWPKPGEEVELPDHEAAELCAAGIAAPLRSDGDDVEKRTADDQPKRRGRPRKQA